MSISRRSFLTASASAAALHLARRRSIDEASLAPTVQSLAKAPAGFVPWLEIDPDALLQNVRTISRLTNGRPIFAVTKNNAYGLGLSVAGPVIDGFAEVQMLAVVRPDEALSLRRAGVRKPILLMGPASEEELMELVPLDVIQSPYRDAAPRLLRRVAQRTQRPVRVHLYIDTGMHRMGMPVTSALPWIEQFAATDGVRIEGAFTELTEDAEFDRQQVARLRDLQTAAHARGISIGPLHAAASDAIINTDSATFLDAVRPGMAIYGGDVSTNGVRRGELRPAYRLKSRVIRVDQVAPGEGVSYHRRWMADRSTWTATIAIGHVDGYPSGAVKGCEVLARGKLFRVVGTVSAGHTVVALGEERPLEVGDEVTLVGPDAPAVHPNEVARRAGWSEYNMFMHLAPGLARVVRG